MLNFKLSDKSTQRRGILEDVAMAEGFEGSSSDHTFERQKQVMSQIRHKLEMLHRVWLVSLALAMLIIARGEADSKLDCSVCPHGSEMLVKYRITRGDGRG
jgi:hypothetical protein